MIFNDKSPLDALYNSDHLKRSLMTDAPSMNGLLDYLVLRPRQNGRLFADDIFKCIFLNENWIAIEISLKFVPNSPINNIPALV